MEFPGRCGFDHFHRVAVGRGSNGDVLVGEGDQGVTFTPRLEVAMEPPTFRPCSRTAAIPLSAPERPDAHAQLRSDGPGRVGKSIRVIQLRAPVGSVASEEVHHA